MKYKPSKFNFCFENEDYTYLYNSYNESDNLVKFQTNHHLDIVKSLSVREIDITGNDSTSAMHWLIANRFIIPVEEDECNKLELTYLKFVTENVLHLYLLPTEDCNLRCKYCYERHNPIKMSEMVQNSIIQYVKKNISSYSGLHISWFGGEPLEAIEIIESLSEKLIKICEISHRKYEADMSTNGYNLSSDVMMKLIKWKIRFFQITLDGLKETHDKLKVTVEKEGTYDKILNNLIEISKNIKTPFLTIVVRSNFIRENLLQIEEYVEKYHTLFGKDKRFFFAPGAAGNWGNDGSSCEQDIFFGPQDMKNMFDQLVESKHVLNFGFFSNFSKHGRNICYASKLHSYAIGSDGTLYKCTCNFEMEENKIGSIDNGTLNIDTAKLSKWIVGAMRHLSAECNDCFFSCKCCGSYCIANSFIKNKDKFCCFPPMSKSYCKQQILLFDRYSPILILK